MGVCIIRLDIGCVACVIGVNEKETLNRFLQIVFKYLCFFELFIFCLPFQEQAKDVCFWAIEPQTLLSLLSVPKYWRDVVYCDTVRFVEEKSLTCRK